MSEGRVADPLRAEANSLDWKYWQWDREVRRLRQIADEIDAEHERRMEALRREGYDAQTY